MSRKVGTARALAGSVLVAAVSVLSGLAVTLCVAVFIDKAGAALSWYARPYYILPLYVVPYIAAALLPWLRYGVSCQ